MRFVLSCVRQRILTPRMLRRLETRLQELARQEAASDNLAQEVRGKEAALEVLRAQLDKVSRNLALAETPGNSGQWQPSSRASRLRRKLWRRR